MPHGVILSEWDCLLRWSCHASFHGYTNEKRLVEYLELTFLPETCQEMIRAVLGLGCIILCTKPDLDTDNLCLILTSYILSYPIVSPYFQAGLHCFCGNDFGRYGLVQGCTVSCPGDSRYKCGGFQANYIYLVDGR